MPEPKPLSATTKRRKRESREHIYIQEIETLRRALATASKELQIELNDLVRPELINTAK